MDHKKTNNYHMEEYDYTKDMRQDNPMYPNMPMHGMMPTGQMPYPMPGMMPNMPYGTMPAMDNMPYGMMPAMDNMPYGMMPAMDNMPYATMPAMDNMPYATMPAMDNMPYPTVTSPLAGHSTHFPMPCPMPTPAVLPVVKQHCAPTRMMDKRDICYRKYMCKAKAFADKAEECKIRARRCYD